METMERRIPVAMMVLHMSSHFVSEKNNYKQSNGFKAFSLAI